jgi:hypothetical protein
MNYNIMVLFMLMLWAKEENDCLSSNIIIVVGCTYEHATNYMITLFIEIFIEM